MIKKTTLMALSLSVTFVMACTASRLDMDYGTSASLAKEQQILNAEAGDNLEPVEGLDGVAASNALDRRREEFKQTQAEPSGTVLLGEIK